MTQPIRADAVPPESIEWLWRERIPKGMITVVAGRPDQGKGLFATHVAADVSAGGGKVLYSAAEDSHGLMTVPRLKAAGANLENVLLWRFRMPENQNELHAMIVEQDIALVIMDPFASHLSNGIKRHSDNVRTVLGPLTKVIESVGCSVLIIEHALKRVPVTGEPLAAIGGSGSGLPAAARAAYVFGIDPDDADKRVLAKAKFNIGPEPAALSFEVDVEDLDVVGDVPFLQYDTELMAFDPMRLFQTKKQDGKVGRPPDKRAAAAEWLTNYLAANGKMHAGKVQEDAKQFGMSIKTLRRAAEDMQVAKDPPGGGRNCTWDLPDDVKVLLGLPTQATPASDDPPIEMTGATDEPPSTDTPVVPTTIQPDVDALLTDILGGDGDGDA